MNGHGIGIWLVPDPSTGLVQIHVAQSLYVALEAGGWIAAVVAGLLTAWLVLP